MNFIFPSRFKSFVTVRASLAVVASAAKTSCVSLDTKTIVYGISRIPQLFSVLPAAKSRDDLVNHSCPGTLTSHGRIMGASRALASGSTNGLALSFVYVTATSAPRPRNAWAQP